MKVRRAKVEDALSIAEINVEAWKTDYRGLIADSILDARVVDDKRISTWKDIIQNPDFVVLVCEDKEIEGYLSAGSARDDFEIENEIYALYVKPSAQRKGIGSELIKEYKKMIQNKSFYCYMLKENKKAAGFYEKNGGVICEKYGRDLTIKEQTLKEVCYVFEAVIDVF